MEDLIRNRWAPARPSTRLPRDEKRPARPTRTTGAVSYAGTLALWCKIGLIFWRSTSTPHS